MGELAKLEVNADMGEGFGRWALGPDAELMPLLDVCNIAAGFHASDPTTLHKTVKLAKENYVKVGAHPGFPDLAGFGRRQMVLSEEEVADIITYQTGAVKAFCDLEGIPLNHVKPHGALYFYLLNSRPHCVAAFRAIKAFNVPVYGLPNTLHEEVAREVGLPFVPELFVDIEYSPEGALIPPAKSKKILPQECAQRVSKVATEDLIFAQGKSDSELISLQFRGRPFSTCIHSDLPNAVDNAKAVRSMVNQLNLKK